MARGQGRAHARGAAGRRSGTAVVKLAHESAGSYYLRNACPILMERKAINGLRAARCQEPNPLTKYAGPARQLASLAVGPATVPALPSVMAGVGCDLSRATPLR